MKKNKAVGFLPVALLAVYLSSCEADIVGNAELTNKSWVLLTIRNYIVYDNSIVETWDEEFYGDMLTYEFRKDGTFIIGGQADKSDPLKYTFNEDTRKILVRDKYDRVRFEYVLKTLSKDDLVLAWGELGNTTKNGLLQDWIFRKK